MKKQMNTRRKIYGKSKEENQKRLKKTRPREKEEEENNATGHTL